MSFEKKLLIFFVTLCYVQCKNLPIETTEETIRSTRPETVRHEHHGKHYNFTHKLEDAPLPSMHETPHSHSEEEVLQNKTLNENVGNATMDTEKPETVRHEHKRKIQDPLHKLENAPLPCMHNSHRAHKNEDNVHVDQTNVEKQIEELATKTPDTVRHEHHGKHYNFTHNLENAPLPCTHESPQPLIMDYHSPTAIEGRFREVTAEEHPLVQNVSTDNSMNPQKPIKHHHLDDIEMRNISRLFPAHMFHHPGHSRDIPNSYTFYGLQNVYGGSYGYGQQQFKGYYPTSNVGVVPPKRINARDYYNLISNGLYNNDAISKQGGLFSKLLGSSAARYGMGGFNFGDNAYANVITGLALWNLMNSHTFDNYRVYHFYNFPEWMRRDLSLSYESVVNCVENATKICSEKTKPLCSNENAIYCVATDTVSCPNRENTCVETLIKCDGSSCEDTIISLPCIANFTLSGDDKPENLHIDAFMVNKALCVTAIAVPHYEGSLCDGTDKDEVDCWTAHTATTN